MATTLSIVIGTRNRLESLKQCLGSLLDKIKTNHEIIVTDAGSTDGTLDYLKSLSEIKLVEDGKPIGQARSLNQVFQTLDSTYTCWLSDDNVMIEGMLDLATSILDEHPDIGMVALKVKDVLGPFTDEPYIGGIAKVTDILNCNQGVIRTELLKSVGYFDETFRDYGIDSDLTTKVLLSGYKVVYTKDVAIYHYRDHAGAPGVFDIEERAQRQERGNQLYKDKYRESFKLDLQSRLRRKVGRTILGWINILFGKTIKNSFFSDRLIIHIRLDLKRELLFGYNLRDWRNLLRCQFISLADFWLNRNQPFYLVQYIPPRLRNQSSIQPLLGSESILLKSAE